MEIFEQLTCLFAAEVEERDQSYVVEVPKQEVDVGYVDPTKDYQIALLRQPGQNSQPTPTPTSDKSSQQPDLDQPPVSAGETRVVEISELGDQGDGLTRVERGFVVIVPNTQKGERVRIEIETVRDTVAFGQVLERLGTVD
jgi:predicted RNA-binding protein with TRAM domain